MAFFYYNQYSGESYDSQWKRYLQEGAYFNDINISLETLADQQLKGINKAIQGASKDQVSAIQESTEAICGTLDSGFELLSDTLHEISYGIDDLSNEVNKLASMLDWNLSLIIEQQRITNLLLGNIAVLLRIPDIQKERQYYIEQGIKFLKKAMFDNDFYEHALNNLLKAKEIEETDFFVLHRIGLIYLYSPKHLDLKEAEKYFKEAAKFAIAEFNVGPLVHEEIPIAGEVYEGVITKIMDFGAFVEFLPGKEGLLHITQIDNKEIRNVSDYFREGDKVNVKLKIIENGKFTLSRKELVGNENIKPRKIKNTSLAIDSLKLQTAESYLFAGRCCYIQGKFSEAADYARKAYSLVPQMVEAGYTLAKALAANNDEAQAATILKTVITLDRYYSLKVVSDLDLCTKESVKSLLKDFQENANVKALGLLKDCKEYIIPGSNEIDYLNKIEKLIKDNTYLALLKAIDLLQKDNTWEYCLPYVNAQQTVYLEKMIDTIEIVISLKYCKLGDNIIPINSTFIDNTITKINQATQWSFPNADTILKDKNWKNQIKSKNATSNIIVFLKNEYKFNESLPLISKELLTLAERCKEINQEHIDMLDKVNYKDSVSSGIGGMIGGFILGFIIGGFLVGMIFGFILQSGGTVDNMETRYFTIVSVVSLISAYIGYRKYFKSKRKNYS